jgi:hypothetical protein
MNIIHNQEREDVWAGRLRTLALADPELTADLANVTDDNPFVARLMALAGRHGVALDETEIRRVIQPDPLGLRRRTATETIEPYWPPPGFLPIRAGAHSAGTAIDWAWFGPDPLTEPFFEGDIRRALRRPFNRMVRWRMALADFLADSGRQSGALAPQGFIFHMSRCGSTLMAQMLARSLRNIVVSEAAPIDFAVQTGSPAFLRAMVLAFGRRRSGCEQRLFVKLDSWHALALPLFERAFPGTPWLFLYRDPLEVMVSQQREPGAQMVPQLVASSIFGLEPMTPGPDYTARVLNRICTAAAEALASPRGLAFNYRDLPETFDTRILPHFGFAPDAAERAAMHDALGVDAKSPTMPFTPDRAAKQAAASAHLRALTQTHLAGIVRRLDAIAATQTDRKTLL